MNFLLIARFLCSPNNTTGFKYVLKQSRLWAATGYHLKDLLFEERLAFWISILFFLLLYLLFHFPSFGIWCETWTSLQTYWWHNKKRWTEAEKKSNEESFSNLLSFLHSESKRILTKLLNNRHKFFMTNTVCNNWELTKPHLSM